MNIWTFYSQGNYPIVISLGKSEVISIVYLTAALGVSASAESWLQSCPVQLKSVVIHKRYDQLISYIASPDSLDQHEHLPSPVSKTGTEAS